MHIHSFSQSDTSYACKIFNLFCICRVQMYGALLAKNNTVNRTCIHSNVYWSSIIACAYHLLSQVKFSNITINFHQSESFRHINTTKMGKMRLQRNINKNNMISNTNICVVGIVPMVSFILLC